MCHKFVIENGGFPKCVMTVPESFRSPRSQAKFIFTAHRGALNLLALLFYRRNPPTLLCSHSIHLGGSNIAVLQAKMRAGARTALHSHRPRGLSLGSDSLSTVSRSSYGMTPRQRAKNRRFPMPKPPSPTGKRFSHTNDARHATSPNRVRRHMMPHNSGARPY